MVLRKDRRMQNDLELIKAGLPEVEGKTQVDDKDRREEERYDQDAQALRNDEAREKIENVKADREMRQDYAKRIMSFLYFYAGFCALVLLADAITVDPTASFGFDLADDIILTIVGSTAVAAIGLVGFVARGLFRPPPKE